MNRRLKIKAWTYDLCGNLKDGYVVNDKFEHDEVVLEEPMWDPPNEHFMRRLKQEIKRIFGMNRSVRHENIDLYGDDQVLYIEHICDEGYTPIGEMEVVEVLTEEKKEAIS